MMSTMEEQSFVRPFVTLLVAMSSCILQATTIMPYANLGSLADGSDALVMARVIKQYEHSEDGQTLFRFRLIVEETIKGSLRKGDEFEVQKWEKLIDDRWITMWGDINLYQEARYLMFLEDRGNGLYHPLCFSYYIFEEISKAGQTYLVPSPEGSEIEVIDLSGAEPLYVYSKGALIHQLKAYVTGVEAWTPDSARAELAVSDFANHNHKRSVPSGCTFLNTGGKKLRWNIFPDLSVGIHYGSGAAGCGTADAAAQDAISNIQNAYAGINIIDAGTDGFSANCSDFTAVGADYRSYMDNTYGSYRHVIIQFDDPCGEIADLKSCGGTLAVGGAYGVGSHTYLDTAWATAKYGYIIVNNGVGSCQCSNLSSILTHELTHTMGLGHISASYGTANLNPSCCQSISSLDETCVDYAYPSPGSVQLLPVELISFEGRSDAFANRLTWATASEHNADRFAVERADDLSKEFELIGQVPAVGETAHRMNYEWRDFSPLSNCYYRLRMIDYDGQEELSNIVTIQREENIKPLLFPTQTETSVSISLPDNQLADLKIFSVDGKLIEERKISAELVEVELKDLNSGWYYLRIENQNFSEVFRVLKI